MNELFTKLKSWKRWVWIISTAWPSVVQMTQGGLTPIELVGATIVTALVGMGVIAQEDVARIKANMKDSG